MHLAPHLHLHLHLHLQVGGATAIVTLLRPQDRGVARPAEQQFHVLPLYVPDMSARCCAAVLHVPPREVEEKVARGGLEVLDKFSRTIAVRCTMCTAVHLGLRLDLHLSLTAATREEKMAACKRGRLSQEKKRYLDSLAR